MHRTGRPLRGRRTPLCAYHVDRWRLRPTNTDGEEIEILGEPLADDGDNTAVRAVTSEGNLGEVGAGLTVPGVKEGLEGRLTGQDLIADGDDTAVMSPAEARKKS
jgi:hypothetical protein